MGNCLAGVCDRARFNAVSAINKQACWSPLTWNGSSQSPGVLLLCSGWAKNFVRRISIRSVSSFHRKHFMSSKIPPSRLSDTCYVIGYATLETRSRMEHELGGLLLCFCSRRRKRSFFALAETDDTETWEYNAWEGGIESVADALLIASEEYKVTVSQWTLHSGRDRESVFHKPRTFHDRKARQARRQLDGFLYRYKYAPRMMRDLGFDASSDSEFE